MTPKGVEHDTNLRFEIGDLRVNHSLMPKGVEHDHYRLATANEYIFSTASFSFRYLPEVIVSTKL